MSLLSAIIETLHFKRKDGREYIVYPATKEKAVTDENGERLDRKLNTMQNNISNMVAGKLPEGTTYVDLEGTGAEEIPDDILLDADSLQGYTPEDFALKEDVPEAWDYKISDEKHLQFDGADNNAILKLVENALQVIINGSEGALQVYPTKVDIHGYLGVMYDYYFTMRGADGGALYRLLVDGASRLNIDINQNGAWKNIILLKPDGNVVFSYGIDNYGAFKARKGIALSEQTKLEWDLGSLNTVKTRHFFIANASGNLSFHTLKPDGSDITDAVVDDSGNWRFKNSISAPNLASTTALIEIEQEITDQDLALIAAEQANTDTELRLTALEKEIAHGI